MFAELLVVAGCPHESGARDLLRAALDDADLHHIGFATTVVTSSRAARERGFIGSPTFLLNGRDPFIAEDASPGLACRLYPAPAGAAGLPSIEALRAAVVREITIDDVGTT